MVICKNCGKENKESAVFCTGCGGNLLLSKQAISLQESPSSNEVAPHELNCKNCGKKNKPTAKFCIGCGSPLATQPIPTLTQENTQLSGIINNKYVCLQCGKQNRDATRFCIVCGTDLDAQTRDSRQSQGITGEEVQVSVHSASLIVGDIHEGDTSGNSAQVELKLTENVSTFYQPNVPNYEKENQHEDRTMPESIPITEETSLQQKAKKRKKIIYWIIGILLLVIPAVFSLFIINFNSGTGNTQMATTVKEHPVTPVPSVVTIEDSTRSNATVADSTIRVPASTPTVIKAEAAHAIQEKLIESTAPESPAVPTLQMAINDLDGQEICTDLVFSKNVKLLSYSISKKTMQQCKAIISFKLDNSDTKYTVTMNYKNVSGGYVYESNTCYFKPAPIAEKPTISTATTSMHNVRGDLVNYISGKKIFCGIRYNSITEVIITKVNDRQYYAESGNSSYLVELSINNISRKCQVNYTIDGKLFINQLK